MDVCLEYTAFNIKYLYLVLNETSKYLGVFNIYKNHNANENNKTIKKDQVI